MHKKKLVSGNIFCIVSFFVFDYWITQQFGIGKLVFSNKTGNNNCDEIV